MLSPETRVSEILKRPFSLSSPHSSTLHFHFLYFTSLSALVLPSCPASALCCWSSHPRTKLPQAASKRITLLLHVVSEGCRFLHFLLSDIFSREAFGRGSVKQTYTQKKTWKLSGVRTYKSARKTRKGKQNTVFSCSRLLFIRVIQTRAGQKSFGSSDGNRGRYLFFC